MQQSNSDREKQQHEQASSKPGSSEHQPKIRSIKRIVIEKSRQTHHQSLQIFVHAVTISIALENCAGFGPTVTASAPPRP